MDNNEIKQANRKAMPKFILVVIASAIVGGLVGFLAAVYGLNEMAESLRRAGHYFGSHIAPWLMVALAVLLPGICTPIYRSAKKLLADWDGENEDISEAAEQKLSTVLWISSMSMIVSFFLIAASYSGGFDAIDNEENTLMLSVSIAAFLVLMVEEVLFQQKAADTARKVNPEKKVSVFDTKFQKKWMDSCDEAEKIMIGKCAYKAYSASGKVCLILSIILAVCALIFDIGFLPSLAVCLIWLVNQSVYCREAMRLSKSGNKIS